MPRGCPLFFFGLDFHLFGTWDLATGRATLQSSWNTGFEFSPIKHLVAVVTTHVICSGNLSPLSLVSPSLKNSLSQRTGVKKKRHNAQKELNTVPST